MIVGNNILLLLRPSIIRGPAPGYQAPELFTTKKINLKSDIFSFGILIWQVILKESQPYPGWHPHAIIYKVWYFFKRAYFITLLTQKKETFNCLDLE